MSIDVVENTEANAEFGDPVAAIDPESTELAYSLAGADSGMFSIDDSSGQIRIGAATTVDYESPSDSDGDNIYELVVLVTDGQDGDGNPDDSVDAQIDVTVMVTDVNEQPEFDGSSVSFEVGENTAATTNIGNPVGATDPENPTRSPTPCRALMLGCFPSRRQMARPVSRRQRRWQEQAADGISQALEGV